MRRGWWLCHPGIFHKFVINLTKFIVTKKFHLLAINQLRYRLLSPIKPRRKNSMVRNAVPNPKPLVFGMFQITGKKNTTIYFVPCAFCRVCRIPIWICTFLVSNLNICVFTPFLVRPSRAKVNAPRKCILKSVETS